ncbi:MAG: hypothetical protein ACREO9_01155 [Lysobacterales bacterium]
MATQNSIISCAPQPYFETGSAEVTVDGGSNVSALTNAEGVFDPDLSNRMSVSQDGLGGTEFNFIITFEKFDEWLVDYNLTVALIGCSLVSFEDIAGSPDLNTKFAEDVLIETEFNNVFTGSDDLIGFGHAHNSQNEINTYDKRSMPGIITGGVANIIHYGFGAPAGTNGTATITVHIHRLAANVAARPWGEFSLGHLFIGVDVPLVLDPNAFNWTMASKNQRFIARDLGAKNSEGSLLRQVTGEIIKIKALDVIGSNITSLAGDYVDGLELKSNFLDLIKVNTSYPVLFNPYPYTIGGVSPSPSAEDYNYSSRQNFFSIYGYMDGSLELRNSEFRDGLASEYRASFRLVETR